MNCTLCNGDRQKLIDSLYIFAAVEKHKPCLTSSKACDSTLALDIWAWFSFNSQKNAWCGWLGQHWFFGSCIYAMIVIQINEFDRISIRWGLTPCHASVEKTIKAIWTNEIALIVSVCLNAIKKTIFIVFSNSPQQTVQTTRPWSCYTRTFFYIKFVPVNH